MQWDGDGCSISRASLSMMMTDLTEGKSAEEIEAASIGTWSHGIRNLNVDDGSSTSWVVRNALESVSVREPR